MLEKISTVIDRSRVETLCCQTRQARRGLAVHGDMELLELTLIKRILPYQSDTGLEQIDCHLSLEHGLY